MKRIPMRAKYISRFLFRLAVLAVILVMYFLRSEAFSVLNGFNFFRQFTLLHIIWIIWAVSMIMQVVPTRNLVSIGSQKQFGVHYIDTEIPYCPDTLKHHTKQSGLGAIKVLLLWLALTAVIGVLKKASVIDNRLRLVIITVFYVCDLICVLFWCPFKEWIMKNRCCNTCRIFNWDYFMMFLPGIFCKGFFTISLLAMSLITLAIWEIYNMKYPERFWEGSNDAIKCRNCTEYLCGRRK